MKKFVVIVAGGSGTRMNAAVPKQFLLLKGKPVLYYTIDAFIKAYDDINVIIVLPELHISAGKEIVETFFIHAGIKITTGGQTRFHSVLNGLKFVEENSIVFVHDAVRCIVSRALIHRCYEAAVEFGTSVPVISSRDSLRIITNETNVAIDREKIKLVQTPQTFKSNILLPAFNIEYHEMFTDEASVVESAGIKIHLVDGEENNIKITHPIDLELAEIIMNKIEN